MKRILQSKKENKVLTVVFPHPDDESFMSSGLLLTAKSLGWKTVVIVLTKGDAGKIYINPKGKSVDEIRLAELKKSAKFLKVDKLIVGNFKDGKLKNQRKKWVSWLKRKLEKINSGLIVTYDHSGLSGHPDHIVLSDELFSIVRGWEGQKPELFWVTIPKEIATNFISDGRTDYFSEPSVELALGKYIFPKILAIRSHKSQNLLSLKSTIIFFWSGRKEWYHRVDLRRKYKLKYFDFEI